ncbi:MAG: hypothetical protein K8S25_14940 [Alphaproteobacteria bacterium]|nr:hypothetical protein [Alphaproteobacteria bacterium]
MEHTTNARRLMIALVVGTTATAFVVAPSHNWVVALAAAPLSALLLLRTTAHWQTHFAPQSATVGQVAEFLTQNMPKAWRSPGTGWTREQVRAVVRRITVEHLNVDATFSDDASFIDDLGAD